MKKPPRVQGIEGALANVEDVISAKVDDKSMQELSAAYR